MDERRSKVSADLEARVAGRAPSDQVEVVVELAHATPPTSGSRTDRALAMREAFEDVISPVVAKIQQAGGIVLESTWVNSTLRGVTPVGSIEALAAEDDVQRLDVVHSLVRESQTESGI